MDFVTIITIIAVGALPFLWGKYSKECEGNTLANQVSEKPSSKRTR